MFLNQSGKISQILGPKKKNAVYGTQHLLMTL